MIDPEKSCTVAESLLFSGHLTFSFELVSDALSLQEVSD